MITWDEITSMMRTLLRWWWVSVLALLLSSGTAFYLTQQEIPYYVAHASLQIGNTFGSTVPSREQIAIGSALANFYGELARREPVLKPVQEGLKLPFSWQIIANNMLKLNIISSANLLEIYITDSQPDRAAAIANAVANELISYSPNSPEKIQAEQAAVSQRLSDSEARIQEFKSKIDELTDRQKAATSASDLAEINQTLAELNTSLADEQSAFNQLLSFKNNSVVNSLSFFEQAQPPTEALPSKRKIVIASAGLAGLLLSFLAAIVLERLDSRWRGREVETRFQLDHLGYIPNGEPLLSVSEPVLGSRLRLAREVQANILLAAADRGTRTLMITSPEPSEARAALSIDLADLFARGGRTVLLVDAEFTSSLLTRLLASKGTSQTWAMMSETGHGQVWTHLRPTPLQNVALLPGNTNPDSQPAMIPSLRWRELVENLLSTADMVIFDGPSVLSSADAALLAPHVDGVVLALDPTKDDREMVTKSKKRLLHQNGTRLLGAVTFMPSYQNKAIGSAWRQLRGRQAPALPAPSLERNVDSTNAAASPAHTPIITPAPDVDADLIEREVAGSVTPDRPLVTPMTSADTIVDAVVIETDQVQTPADSVEDADVATAKTMRRPRKSARTARSQVE